jgi:hypothetical protein
MSHVIIEAQPRAFQGKGRTDQKEREALDAKTVFEGHCELGEAA